VLSASGHPGHYLRALGAFTDGADARGGVRPRHGNGGAHNGLYVSVVAFISACILGVIAAIAVPSVMQLIRECETIPAN